MRPLLLVLFLSLCFESIAQSAKQDITIGKVVKLESRILKETRDIWVYVPSFNGPDIFEKQKYPVVYLLDGDGHFQSVVGMIQQLSQINGNTIVPEMIVVGIPNTDRTRDLTPTHVKGGPFMDSNFTKTSGGGMNFQAFLEKELIPFIDSNYSTAPYRVFIGHSFGGLTVMNTLLHEGKLFNAYIAIDPSMWWDNQHLLKETPELLHKEDLEGRKLFVGVANTMPQKMDTAKVRNDKSPATLHIRSILQLVSTLKTNAPSNLKWNYRYYPTDDHGSVPLISEYDGLHFIFDFYKAPQFFGPNAAAGDIEKSITEHYEKVSKEMGYKVTPPEPLVNQMGYNFLQQKNMDKAYSFFKMNVDNYPKSFNVYDSMGDYYVKKGDKEKAKEYFRKALDLKDNPDTRKKLEEL